MKYIIGNQKSFLTKEEAIKFANETYRINSNNKVIICPTDLYFGYFKNITLGSQNVADKDIGNYTGEVTVSQLKSMGIEYCIVGHSERRINLKEDGSLINRKIKCLQESNVIPILCIGESFEEKENGSTKEVLKKEIEEALVGIDNVSNIIIAYEPIWSISDGVHPSRTPSNSEIDDVALYIKDLIRNNYNASCPVIYGGSVNPTNVDELNKINSIDGYLIGGSSKKIEDFISIIEKC